MALLFRYKINNSMPNTAIIAKAIDEIQQKTFGITEQLLKVHEVVYENDMPKVLHVEDRSGGSAIVYFPIKDEKFYVAVYLNTEPEISVTWVESVSFHSVYFRASSDSLSFEQLAALTKLQVTSGWNKGDARKYGASYYKFSAIEIEPHPEPGEFENKLRKLLDVLEQDREGILQLAHNANGYIQVMTVFHNGNTMLGGHHLDRDIIKRLAALNVAIDFDLYAEGNFYRD